MFCHLKNLGGGVLFFREELTFPLHHCILSLLSTYFKSWSHYWHKFGHTFLYWRTAKRADGNLRVLSSPALWSRILSKGTLVSFSGSPECDMAKATCLSSLRLGRTWFLGGSLCFGPQVVSCPCGSSSENHPNGTVSSAHVVCTLWHHRSCSFSCGVMGHPRAASGHT